MKLALNFLGKFLTKFQFESPQFEENRKKPEGCFQMPKVRIKLNSTDIDLLNNICESVKDIAKKSGIAISGPVPLPTKKLKITTRKSPCGNGTATFDNFEMRIHSRLIDVPADDRLIY